MRQKSYFNSAKQKKFEDGVLCTDSCMKRYSISRKYQYRTSFEDLPSYSFGLSALREEKRLMRKVYQIMEKGFKPKGDESLEVFVERHKDVLGEVI